jgi:uncharacterized membrane protein
VAAMVEGIRAALAPYYLDIKFIHLVAVSAWIWSTSVAYMYYLVPVFRAWRRNPGDLQIIALRDWVMDRFDSGATYEHVAFPVVLLSGALLIFIAGWTLASTWLVLKLLIVIGLFVPIEVCDYYLSHFGGNKARLRAQGTPDRVEASIHRHWWFLLLTTPLITIFPFVVVFLAVTKSP